MYDYAVAVAAETSSAIVLSVATFFIGGSVNIHQSQLRRQPPDCLTPIFFSPTRTSFYSAEGPSPQISWDKLCFRIFIEASLSFS